MKKIKQGIALAIAIFLCLSLNQAALNGLGISVQQDTGPVIAEAQSIKEAPGGILIDFDDLTTGTFIGTYYDDVTFSAGFLVQDMSSSPYYPPYSLPNIAYTNTEVNDITFANHVSYVSLYVCTVFDYNIEIVAYTTTDLVVDSAAVGVNVTNQFIEINAPSGVISKISIIGDSGFNNYISIDNLFYLEYEPTIHRTITFDDFATGVIEDTYPDITFSPGYQTINTSLNPNYPPESGDFVAYTLEINNWFIFELPIQKVGFFLSTANLDYELVVSDRSPDAHEGYRGRTRP